MDGTWVRKCLQTMPPWCTRSTSGPETSRPSQLSAVSHVPCMPSVSQVFRVTLGLPLPSQLFLLPPDNPYTEVSLVWACVSLLSAVFLLGSAAACSSPGPESVQGWPHKGSDVPWLQLPPSPARNPRWGSGLTSLSNLKILCHKSTLPVGAPQPANDPVCCLRMQQYSADSGSPFPTLRTAHPSFCPSTLSLAASNTPPAAFHPPFICSFFPCPPANSVSVTSLLASSDCWQSVGGVSPQLPPACLLASLPANLSTVSSSYLSRKFFNIFTHLLFYNSSLTHNRNSKEDLKTTAAHCLNSPFGILCSPLLTCRCSSHPGMRG